MLKTYYDEAAVEAGCDEAGRGCLAGPVVAAAVILPKDFDHHELNDSKQLAASRRTHLRKEIEQIAEAWAVGIVSPAEIDEINILNASFLAMHRAIDQLQITPELLLIDGNRFTSYPNIEHKCIVKGDAKFFSIAAASVLAKTYRDEIMHKLAIENPGYGWETNVGYPTKIHREGIKRLGTTPYHRMSFQLLPRQLSMFE